MDYSDISYEIRKTIASQLEVDKNTKFIIHPFSINGLITKDLLENQFGIKPIAIIDDNISKFNPEVHPVNYLGKIDMRNTKILMVDNNPKVVDVIRFELYKWVPRETVIDVFETYSYDRRVTWLRNYSEIVHKHRIEGDVAECGVYKGEFARYINMFFSDRKLFLFDSFQGFRNEDFVNENDSNNSSLFFSRRHMDLYRDTNPNEVLRRMTVPDKVVVKPGFVPESLNDPDIGDKFAFVHLDMDIYKPMLGAINYFYPRMSVGGVILIHDYFNFRLPGVEKAVDDYEKETNTVLYKVPGADMSGMAIIKSTL